MANFVYIATSIDGFIATEDGGVEWLENVPNHDGSDLGFADFTARIDALVMGRKTYEKVLDFGQWPYEKPVFVLSNSLKSVPENLEGKADIVSGEIVSVIETLRSRGFQNLYIDGGKVIQSFLSQDLIDELIITRLPVLLGKGIPLFAELDEPLHFTHLSTKVLCDSLVQSRYIRER